MGGLVPGFGSGSGFQVLYRGPGFQVLYRGPGLQRVRPEGRLCCPLRAPLLGAGLLLHSAAMEAECSTRASVRCVGLFTHQ